MRHCFILLLMFLLIHPASAQSDNKSTIIHGQVIDSITLSPIPYATISVQWENNHYQDGTVTDENGNFSISLPGSFKYMLHISCVGYISCWKQIPFSDDNIHIGKIKLQEESIQLSEVAVTARKERIKLSNSGLTYDMKNDPLLQSENLLFALRNVPLVTVDGNGEIRVKGSSSFSIYLNGKPYRIATMNPKEVLKSIPAASIAKVELITLLDARHDASTGDAIINIITDKKGIDGYKVLLNSSAETHPKAGTGISSIITKGKIDFSLSYDYQYTHESNQKIKLKRDNLEDGEVTSRLNTNGIANGDFQYHTGRGMLVYNIDTLHSLYADAHLLLTDVNFDLENRQIFEKQEKQYNKRKEISDYSSGASEFNLVYQNLYKKDKSERLTLGYRYAYNPDKRKTEVTGYEYPIQFTDWNKKNEEYRREKNETNGGLREHTLQFDYKLLLGKRHSLRFGGKDVLRKSSATPEYLLWNGNNWVENDTETNIGRMEQMQNIASAYLTYNYKRKKINLNIGGRVEYSHNKMKFKDNPQNNFTSDLVDFIPRGNLSYNLSAKSQLQLAFSSGVTRPSIWNLNPFCEQLNDYQVKYGNPNLKSQKQYKTTLSYITYNNQWFMVLDVDYNRTNDAIVEYPFRKENNPEILVYTYGNIGSYQRIGGSFFLNYKPIDALSFSTNGTLTNNHIESNTLHIKDNELSYNASVSYDTTLPHDWLLGGKWSIFKPMPQIRTSYSNTQMYSFYIYKRFMDGNLSIGITANQPFNRNYSSRSTVTSESFIQSKTNYVKARSLCISVSYGFGSGKAKDIKRNEKIRNTDLQQSTGVR